MRLAIQETAVQGGLLTNLCQMAGVFRACYYRGLAISDPVDKAVALCQSIQQVALDWSCYGYRRVTHALHRQGTSANHKRVLRLMCEDNLLCLRKKRFAATTNSDHWLPVYPNLASEMDVTVPDQLWVSDLTYIRLGHEFIYLAVVLDACSRRCLGWSLSRRLDAALATTALKMALRERKPQVHHSVGSSFGSWRSVCVCRVYKLAERERHCHQHAPNGTLAGRATLTIMLKPRAL